jgi:hypothetical protein
MILILFPIFEVYYRFHYLGIKIFVLTHCHISDVHFIFFGVNRFSKVHKSLFSDRHNVYLIL